MRLITRCPNCNSSAIGGSVFLENGVYVQRIICKKCKYQNKREIGNAERKFIKE